MPSAQEGRFRFGDRVIATDSKRVGIVIDTLRYEGSLVYYAVAFDSGVTYHLGPDQLEPADSPGRAVAQQGWRERVDEAISQLEDAYADYARTLSDACYARVERQREVVGALLDEVTELPAVPPDFNIPPGSQSVAEVFGPHYALHLAAAHVRDAKQVRGSQADETSKKG